jgi:hypothetical protein
VLWKIRLEDVPDKGEHPVSQQEIPRGDKLIEFQAEGGGGMAMTGGIAIRVTLFRPRPPSPANPPPSAASTEKRSECGHAAGVCANAAGDGAGAELWRYGGGGGEGEEGEEGGGSRGYPLRRRWLN